MEDMQQFYEGDVKGLVYEFFLKFSRFEFSLKASGFVRTGMRKAAVADWKKFYQKFGADYHVDDKEKQLLKTPPNRQVYIDQKISWQDFEFPADSTDLEKITLALRSMRNNLFHGGKYGEKSWDDGERVRFVLSRGVHSLERMAELDGDINIHFHGFY